MLTARQCAVDSLVCVGLDPLVEKMPQSVADQYSDTAEAVMHWMRDIVDATAPFACMFKPQHAHWEAIPGGVDALQKLVEYIHLVYPDIPVFMDCKRGDIDRTQRQYRDAHFGLEGADGMNYNGYMGKETLRSLFDLNHPGRALVGLGRTSNPDAWEIQDALMADGKPVWVFMVERLYTWSLELDILDNAGIVMGAAHKEDPSDPANKAIYSQHLSRAREIVGDKMWFLIPGIGAQGGFVEQTIKACFAGPGSIAINSSSGIIFASAGEDYAVAAAREAEKLRDQIRAAGGGCT